MTITTTTTTTTTAAAAADIRAAATTTKAWNAIVPVVPVIVFVVVVVIIIIHICCRFFENHDETNTVIGQSVPKRDGDLSNQLHRPFNYLIWPSYDWLPSVLVLFVRYCFLLFWS